MSDLIKHLGRQSQIFLITLGFVFVVLLGGIDYLTGPEFAFSIFYLLPVSMVAWLVGRGVGAMISIFSALTSLVVDLALGQVYSHPAIPEWNALANLGFFLIVTYVLTILQATTYKREELMQFIVHDLRSPLSVIILGLSVLQRAADEMNETQQGLVKSTLASSRWMSTLINSILDLSRLESKQIPLQIDEIKVRELIELSVEQVALWVERSQISLTIELNTDKETVHADRELTMRILVNLLSNAIKLSPPQSVVTVRVTPAAANMLAFSVADQGPGIPQKWIERVFDKFTQIEARRAGVSVGSGLGLTFCRLAVEAQRGRISLTSEVGQGTTVTFTLPILAQP